MGSGVADSGSSVATRVVVRVATPRRDAARTGARPAASVVGGDRQKRVGEALEVALRLG